MIAARYASLLAFAQSRGGDCGANADGGGGFQKGNTCAAGDGGPSRAPSGDVSKRLSSGREKASKVMQDLGFRRMNFTAIDKALSSANDTQRQRILADLDTLAKAIKVDSRLANVAIRVGPMREIFKGQPEVIKSFERDGGACDAAADPYSDSLAMFTDEDEYDEEAYDTGFNSSTNRAAVVLHELAHLDHYRNAQAKFPAPEGEDPVDYSLGKAHEAGDKLLKSDRALREKVKGVSEYATTDVFEFVAEYSAAVSLGEQKNDKDLDRLCNAVGAKPPRRRV